MELSIVVPIYNVELYLEECLDSIYKIQGMKKEVILVNDGSTDNSLEIARKYEKKYKEETVLIDKKNGGLSSARNAGLKVATGEYIAFFDSDDIIDINLFQEFYKEGKKAQLDIVVGNIRYYQDRIISSPLFRSDKVKSQGVVSGLQFLEILFEKPKCFREEVCDDLYRREFLIENNLFFYEGLIHEDSLFTPLAYIKAKKVKYFDYPFYLYRQRIGGIMSRVDQKSIDSLEKISFLLIEEYNKLSQNLGKKALSKLIISFYKVVVYKEYDKKGNYKEKYKQYREIFKELKGFDNWILNETLLFLSLKTSIYLRKILNKEIVSKSQQPKLKK